MPLDDSSIPLDGPSYAKFLYYQNHGHSNKINSPDRRVPKERKRSKKQLEYAKLEFKDLKLGKFIGNGIVNIVSLVELPEWYRQHHNMSTTRAFVIKLTPGGEWFVESGNREIEIWKSLGANFTEAKKHRIVPLLWEQRNFTNPFFRNPSLKIPESFPRLQALRLRLSPHLVAQVLPYLHLDYPCREIFSVKSLRRYFKSLLEILVYAHSLGINNFDLKCNNALINVNGYAVITDWNAGKQNGENLFDPTAYLRITAPEGMIERTPDGLPITQTILSAMDIWSVGAMMADIAFRPCRFVMNSKYPEREGYPQNYHLIQELLTSLGGETTIPISKDKTLDLAALVNWNSSLHTEFEVPLRKSAASFEKCNLKHDQFERLKDATEQDWRDLRSLLQKALKVSPSERPDAASLLKHRFFQTT